MRGNDRLFLRVTALAGLLLLLAVFLGCVNFWGFNREFYRSEYEKLDTASYIGMSSEDLTNSTDVLLGYITDERDDLNVTAVVNGQERQVFNEREISHMVDVKNLYLGAMTLGIICFAVAILLVGATIYFMKKRSLRVMAKGFFASNVIFMGILAVLALWAVFDFNTFWTSFHHVFFAGNDLWILDPTTDILIMMVPSQFFFDLIMSIVLTFVAIDGILLAVSGIYLKRSKRAHT